MCNNIMSDNQYYHKYLKYKKKYLDLKNDIDGGMNMFKKKPLTKEKFDKELEKIMTDFYRRSDKLETQYAKSINRAYNNQIYYRNRYGKCWNDRFQRDNGYETAGRCERDNDPTYWENLEDEKENIRKNFRKSRDYTIKKYNSIKNSTNDLDSKLQELKDQYKTHKTLYPISLF